MRLSVVAWRGTGVTWSSDSLLSMCRAVGLRLRGEKGRREGNKKGEKEEKWRKKEGRRKR